MKFVVAQVVIEPDSELAEWVLRHPQLGQVIIVRSLRRG
jgi:hypothetical protein